MDKTKFNYKFMMKKHHEDLIWECVELLQKLNIRFSKSIRFGYLVDNISKLGLCVATYYRSKGFFIIRINEAINNDKTFIETAIHELLHTITDSDGELLCLNHRGPWKEVAEFVSKNTPFEIKTSSKEQNILTFLDDRSKF